MKTNIPTEKSRQGHDSNMVKKFSSYFAMFDSLQIYTKSITFYFLDTIAELLPAFPYVD